MATRISTRARLLAATEVCLARDGIRRTTMVGIAEEAGVSRAALYKYFPDKASLVVEALVRIDDEFWRRAAERVSARHTLGDQVVEAVRFAREQEPGALLLRLNTEEPDAVAATVGAGLRALAPGMAAFWTPYLAGAKDRGEVRPDLDVVRASEWIIRVVVSLVTMPPEDGDDRSLVEGFLLPGLRGPVG